MTLGNFTWPAFAGGLAALAALLFLLQRLRVRPRNVTVPTTLFWRAAVEPATARSLFHRFQQPWAFALLLLICALLWLAIADPRPTPREDGTLHIAVLDGSAAMSVGSRFAAASTALQAHVRALPVDRRQVLWCGAEIHTLLNPGEHELLLPHRLAALLPEAAPSQLESLLASLAHSATPEHPIGVTLFSDAPLALAAPSSNAAFRVASVASSAHEPGTNYGLVALGLADAASGEWTEVDVYAEAAASEGAAPMPAVQFDLDGIALPASRVRAIPAAHGVGYALAGLPATGGVLTARLPSGDSLAFDNVAQLRLPNRPRIRVQLSPSLETLRPALAADSAVELVSDHARLAIRRAGESIGTGLPALEFVPRGNQPAFQIVHPSRFDSAVVLHEAADATGLREIDATALATSLAAPIAVGVEPGAEWRIQLWDDLLTPSYNFTSSRAFPLFLSNSVRWLARTPGLAPVVAAGRPWVRSAPDNAAHAIAPSGVPLDTLGDFFTPLRASPLAVEGESQPLLVSLLDRPTTANRAAATDALTPAARAGFSLTPATGLLLAVLLLLLAEWHLHQRSRVP